MRSVLWPGHCCKCQGTVARAPANGLAAGAGFLYALAGEIQTMPGLPADPAALRIDVDPTGNITGLT
jgi:formyltetrahydrofolate synthetase